MMPQSSTAFVALLLLITGLAGQAADPDFTLAAVSAERYQSLPAEADKRVRQGVVKHVSAAPDVFAAVTVEFLPKWPPGSKDPLKIEAKTVQLEVGGQMLEPLGCLSAKGLDSTRSVYERPPREPETAVVPVAITYLYRIPARTAAATLKIGDKSKKLSFAGKVLATPPASDPGAKARVIGTKWYDKLPMEARFSSDKYPSIRRNPAGRILAVTFVMEPERANLRGDYHWRTDAVTLVTDDGQSVFALGQGPPDDVSWSTQNYVRLHDGKWEEKEVTYYFAVPATLKSFKLARDLQLIGTGTVTQ